MNEPTTPPPPDDAGTDDAGGMTRRQVLAAAIGGTAAVAMAAGAATAGAGKPNGSHGAQAAGDHGRTKASTGRLPVVYLPHGGGPWPFMKMSGFFDDREAGALTEYLQSLPSLAAGRLKAMLVISAHWEEAVPTVMTGERPPMFYDYYGFPPETYTLTWPAPGDPKLAARVRELLGAAGFPTATDDKRGFDHGTFVPLKVAFPAANVPTVQLSLRRGLDPAEHIRIGRALAPLRDEGVLIVGSGMSYHNMRGFGGVGERVAATFDAWLQGAATAAPDKRLAALEQWAAAPAARQAHPREEHLLPLMVIAGAAGDDAGRTAYSDTFARVRISAFHYG